VKRLPYGEIYTKQEETAAKFSEANPAVMVDNECVIVTGATLLQAFDRLEVMESTAHSIINSMAVGNIVHISQEEVEDLKVAFNLKD
jgi:L-fuculose-phosphate aldolase